jgi:hypothetical protein
VKQASVISNDEFNKEFDEPVAWPVNPQEKPLRIGCRKEG